MENNITTEEIKALTEKHEDERFFKTDPISIVKRYSDPKDIEIAAVICSTLAFGKRSEIYKACEKTMELMGNSPYEYMQTQLWEKYEGDKSCWYRMLTWHDFYMICFKLNKVYRLYNDLQDCLIDTCNSVATSHIEAVTMIFNSCNGIPKNAVSTCKRICLMLRWLVREDSKIDIGVWNCIEPHELLLPLDVHSLNTLRKLGVTTRKSHDMKMVIQATEWAKTISPDDPTKLDFFLFGYSYEQVHPKEFEE